MYIEAVTLILRPWPQKWPHFYFEVIIWLYWGEWLISENFLKLIPLYSIIKLKWLALLGKIGITMCLWAFEGISGHLEMLMSYLDMDWNGSNTSLESLQSCFFTNKRYQIFKKKICYWGGGQNILKNIVPKNLGIWVAKTTPLSQSSFFYTF